MSQESNDTNKPRCVIYARSATCNAKDLQRQIQDCHGYILEHPHLALAGLYVEGPASRLSPNRPQLHSLLNAVQQIARDFDCVVIENANRLARDFGLLADIAQKFAISGITPLSPCSRFHRCAVNHFSIAINCDAEALERLRQRVLKGQSSRSALASFVEDEVKSGSGPKRTRWFRSQEKLLTISGNPDPDGY